MNRGDNPEAGIGREPEKQFLFQGLLGWYSDVSDPKLGRLDISWKTNRTFVIKQYMIWVDEFNILEDE